MRSLVEVCAETARDPLSCGEPDLIDFERFTFDDGVFTVCQTFGNAPPIQAPRSRPASRDGWRMRWLVRNRIRALRLSIPFDK